MPQRHPLALRSVAAAVGAVALCAASLSCPASDHLDTRTVIDDPRADIGDLFAWTAPDGKRLNLVMTVVGHSFSSELHYTFHLDSGAHFDQADASIAIDCRFPAADKLDCKLGDVDRARGDAGNPAGIEGRGGRFRVFAGLRDDPFFNNVKGARDAYQVAAAALKRGATVDAANCPALDPATSKRLLDTWRSTDGGPATDFLEGWTPAALVVSVDLDAITGGGRMLAVWATTAHAERQLDRMGRPLTGNALLAPLAADAVSDALKEQFNAGGRVEWARLVPAIQETLGLYDGFDGVCGNQRLADSATVPTQRYRAMAELLADDRLWVNADAPTCKQFFAVELAHLGGRTALLDDCGGRTPTQDAVDVYRSLLVNGTTNGVDDGVDHDSHLHSTSEFPFLAAPSGGAYSPH